MNPSLSIIIPTKDRYSTLIPVLKGLSKDFKNLDIEIIVQDNSEKNDPILQFLSDLNCPKIKYFHYANPIPVTENCDKAILNSMGEYLIMIGDDDFVLPSIMENLEWMVLNKVDCLNSNTAVYNWPDITSKYNTYSSKSSTLFINSPITKKYEYINPKKELLKVASSGATGIYNLPRLYHGIVKRTVLESIYRKCRTYFPGPSPDMANSVALACSINSFAMVKFPFSISGKSKSSTSGMGANHQHVGKLENIPFLDKKLIKNWDPKIPYIWTGSTIWAQSFVSSLNFFEINISLNYFKLYANLLIFESGIIPIIKKTILYSLKSNPANFLILIFYSFSQFCYRSLNYILRKLQIRKKCLVFYDISEIQACKEIIESNNH